MRKLPVVLALYAVFASSTTYAAVVEFVAQNPGSTDSFTIIGNSDETYDIFVINEATNQAFTRSLENQTAIANEISRATTAESGLDTRITGNQQAINSETSRATAAESALDTRVTGNQQDIAAETSRATAAESGLDTRINTNTQEIGKTNQRVTNNERQLSNHEGRIETLEANQGYGNKFADLKNQVDDNRKHASAGISGAMAMASIPQVMQDQTFAVGAGIGGYDDENAIAVGASFRASRNVVVKANVSNDSQQNFGYGAGVSLGW